MGKYYLCVTGRDPLVWTFVLVLRMRAVCSEHVDVSWDDQREKLLSCPQRFRLQDRWLRNFSVPCRQIHQQVHDRGLQMRMCQRKTSEPTRSIKTSLLVIIRTAQRVSCTIPITGLFACGVMSCLGTIAISSISALVSSDCGR